MSTLTSETIRCVDYEFNHPKSTANLTYTWNCKIKRSIKMFYCIKIVIENSCYEVGHVRRKIEVLGRL